MLCAEKVTLYTKRHVLGGTPDPPPPPLPRQKADFLWECFDSSEVIFSRAETCHDATGKYREASLTCEGYLHVSLYRHAGVLGV